MTTFDGKLQEVATDFAESAMAQAVHQRPPDTKLQPAYFTKPASPTAIAGRVVALTSRLTQRRGRTHFTPEEKDR